MSFRSLVPGQPPQPLQTLIVVVSALIASVLAAYFEAFERFCAWARDHEQVEADELLITGVIFCIAFFFLFVLRDIELRKHLAATEAARISAFVAAHEDDLTGLPNRRAFMEHGARTLRQRRKFHVLLLDLDGFKAINDKLGHEAGDEILLKFALQLNRNIKDMEGCFIARLGGDEFAMIVEQHTECTIVDVAQRIIDIASILIPRSHGLLMGTSIGIAPHKRGASVSDTLRAADGAMYLAKQSGGSCYRFSACND